MGDKTNIEWTDATWNPVVGCSIKSAGCTNCYAMKMARRLELMGQPIYQGHTQTVNGKAVWTGKVEASNWGQVIKPLSWKKPRRIFVNSMSDLFHENLAEDVIDQVFAVMALCPQHTFQVLTKRPERMFHYLTRPFQDRLGTFSRQVMIGSEVSMIAVGTGATKRPSILQDGDELTTWPLPNVWLGTSVEDQRAADERIPLLLQTPAAKRFLSCEPLLGPLNIKQHLEAWEEHGVDMTREVGSRVGACVGVTPGLDWVIAGSESGHGARPCDIEWVRSLKDQCVEAGVPFFYKQAAVNGKKVPTPELDGRQWIEFPS